MSDKGKKRKKLFIKPKNQREMEEEDSFFARPNAKEAKPEQSFLVFFLHSCQNAN